MSRVFLSSMRCLSVVLLCGSLGMLPLAAFAQDAPARSAQETEAREREARLNENRKQALAALREMIPEVERLQSPENRLSFFSEISTMLGPCDKEVAEALAVRAVAAIGELVKTCTEDDEARCQGYFALYYSHLGRMNQINPKLGLQLLRETRGAYFPDLRPEQNRALDQMDTQFEILIAKDDPKKIYEVAKRSLDKTFSYELSNLFGELRSRDPGLAAAFAGEVLQKLGSADIAKTYEAANAATGFYYQLQSSVQASQDTSAATLDRLRRQYLDKLIDIALASRSAAGTETLLRFLKERGDEVNRVAPSRAAAIQARLAESGFGNRYADARNDEYQRLSDLSQKGTVDDILAAAAKASNPENAYEIAVNKAANTGDFVRARQIAAEKLTNSSQRKYLLASIDERQMYQSVNKSDYVQARQLIARLPRREQRINARINLAQQIGNRYAGKRNPALATELLDEALQDFGGQPNDRTNLSWLLRIAAAYAQIAPERGFILAEQGLSRLNELLPAFAALDGFGDGGQQLQNGEFLLFHGSYAGAFGVAQQIGESLGMLAGEDFDRALALAGSVQRPELSLYLRLRVTQGIYSQTGGLCVPERK